MAGKPKDAALPATPTTPLAAGDKPKARQRSIAESNEPPHLLAYQGSKRRLGPQILAVMEGTRVRRLYEPCCGSAAVSLRAASKGVATTYVLGDSLDSLVELWRLAIDHPDDLADAYASRWSARASDARARFEAVRDAFNRSHEPADLLYLLARCVKSAPRFNRDGHFNQGADHRRLGTRPATMRGRLRAVAALLRGRAILRSGDLVDNLADAQPGDLVYLDPPYLGTSSGRNPRYHQGLDRERLIAVLADLDRRDVPLVLSYDGRTGEREYGPPLPDDLGLRRFSLRAGRSSQGTLSGHRVETFESLYVSRGLEEAAARVLPRW